MNHLEPRSSLAPSSELDRPVRRHTPSPRRASLAPAHARPWLLSLGLLGLAATALPRPAWAQQTETCDLNCPRGTTCELLLACALIGCEEDSPDCAPCEGPGSPWCAPAACTTDSDCGDSMVCFEFRDDCATDPLLVPSSPEPPACQPSSFRECVPRWHLPCSVDSDCGEGFRCEEDVSCGVPAYDPSSGEPASSEVTCTPRGTFSCAVLEMACETSADCPDIFDCVENEGACSVSSDGQTECATPEPARVCEPRPGGLPVPPDTVGFPARTGGGPTLTDSDDDALLTSPDAAGCSLLATSPASPLALFSTLGLALTLVTRRHRRSR